MNLIAIKMLIGDRAKYLGLIFGIMFATLLMAQQLSLFIGIMQRTSKIIEDVSEVDIWVMDKRVSYLDGVESIADTNLNLVRSIPGVKWAVPFYKGQVVMRIGDVLQASVLIGFDDVSYVGAPKEMIMGNLDDLKKPDSVIIDKTGYQYIWPGEPFKIGRTIEVNDRRMEIVGICNAAQPFSVPVIIFARYSQAIKYLPPGRNKMSFVLAKVKEDFDLNEVAKKIEEQTNLKAKTWQQFKADTINYFMTHTGIPINFGITVLLGFIIGAVISGQTFYIFVIENLRQFGTLKAIGVNNRKIIMMVLTQAAVVGFIGFSIGIGLTSIFFSKVGQSVPAFQGFYLYWQVVVGTAAAVFLIMIIASFASIRKVFKLDPAIVFRS
jgi:putative ABC transport system permease protein